MHELLSPTESARADSLTEAAGVSGQSLMEAAGRAVARAVLRRIRPCPTLVLCGPGNNGGDGYVMAQRLAELGWPVAVASLAKPRPGSDAEGAASRWRGPYRPFTPEEAGRAGLVIDAVFGAGLSADIGAPVAETLRAARRVVAIDVPSGVDGATGLVRGSAPQAMLTITFFRAKPGHFLLPGRDLCGELVVAEIGIPESVLAEIGAKTFANRPGLWRLPGHHAQDHKYARGVVTVLGGATMPGAARLAAGAARHAGAGMVTIAATRGAELYRATEPGLIVSDQDLPQLLQDTRRTTWVCGPGLGADAAATALPLLLAGGRHVVVDADALTICAGAPERLRGATVLTPHEGEFTRVFGKPIPDRLSAAREAAGKVGAVVVLKGSDTIIAAPDGRAAINANAPPWLATAGAGDVLSGIIAALLSQGMPPWEAACAGAWLHGEAARIAGAGMIAEDLPGAISKFRTDSVAF
jgi:hydroxyethylthiazole kinase-like uncharacterized protein yjeF